MAEHAFPPMASGGLPVLGHARQFLRDPTECFSPEHDESRQPHSLIGFGGGIHRCVGVHFAYLEMKIALSLLLQQYDFTLLDPEPHPVRGTKTKWPASPCRVHYRRRAHLPYKTARHRPPVGAAQPAGAPATHCPVPH